LVAAPEIEVEEIHQLAGCRERQQFAAFLEAAVLNDPVKHFRLEPRDDMRDMPRLQDAFEHTRRVWSRRAGQADSLVVGLAVRLRRVAMVRAPARSTRTGFRHGLGMLPAPGHKKQS
jgi:hypothetical protein